MFTLVSNTVFGIPYLSCYLLKYLYSESNFTVMNRIFIAVSATLAAHTKFLMRMSVIRNIRYNSSITICHDNNDNVPSEVES